MNTLALLFCLVASAMAVPMLPRLSPFSDNMIVGGTPAVEGEFPYQISLQKMGVTGYYHTCGGSIISEKTVLCAAHCIYGGYANEYQVVVGQLDFDSVSGHEQTFKVAALTINKEFDYSEKVNDISLVHIHGTFTFNDYVQPIALPAQGTEYDEGASCTVSGWGDTTEGGHSSHVLLKLDLSVVSDEQCNVAYGEGDVADSMICAIEDNKGTCQGDSGGPLTIGGEQIGIVSWCKGCARPGYPGVYTQVSYYIDWINENIT